MWSKFCDQSRDRLVNSGPMGSNLNFVLLCWLLLSHGIGSASFAFVMYRIILYLKWLVPFMLIKSTKWSKCSSFPSSVSSRSESVLSLIWPFFSKTIRENEYSQACLSFFTYLCNNNFKVIYYYIFSHPLTEPSSRCKQSMPNWHFIGNTIRPSDHLH